MGGFISAAFVFAASVELADWSVPLPMPSHLIMRQLVVEAADWSECTGISGKPRVEFLITLRPMNFGHV